MIGSPSVQPPPNGDAVISLWLKIPCSVFLCLFVPVYWDFYGPANFLWGSDIALFGTLLALWTESRLLASMMALGVLLPEVAWNVDFAVRSILGPDAIAVSGTRYMFDPEIPLFVRGLSSFHVALPVILVWLVYRLGYDRKALIWQTLLAWLVLPISYAVSDPSTNINWVYGLGDQPQTWMPGPLFVVVLMGVFPLVVYLPTHFVLRSLFSDSGLRS